MTLDPFLILGIVGMAVILTAFLLEQTHRLTADDSRYDALNAVGSVLLVLYALDGRAWPFLILNAVWAAYSIKDLVFKRGSRVRSR